MFMKKQDIHNFAFSNLNVTCEYQRELKRKKKTLKEKIYKFLFENKPMTIWDYLFIFGISALIIGLLVWISIDLSEMAF